MVALHPRSPRFEAWTPLGGPQVGLHSRGVGKLFQSGNGRPIGPWPCKAVAQQGRHSHPAPSPNSCRSHKSPDVQGRSCAEESKENRGRLLNEGRPVFFGRQCVPRSVGPSRSSQRRLLGGPNNAEGVHAVVEGLKELHPDLVAGLTPWTPMFSPISPKLSSSSPSPCRSHLARNRGPGGPATPTGGMITTEGNRRRSTNTLRCTAGTGYRSRMSLSVKVLDFVQSGGPDLTVDSTIFEIWMALQ